MPNSILPVKRAPRRRDGGHRLRVRAVLHEDSKARQQDAQFTRRSGKPQTHTIIPAPEHLAARPALAHEVQRSGMLPSIKRSKSKLAARINRAHAMHHHGGELVLLRLTLDTLDGLPLRVEPTTRAAREEVNELLARYAPKALAYDVAIQRGKCGGFHAHVLVPLAFLSPYPRRKAQHAPAGKGGGVSIGSRLHVVRVAETKQDRAAVAAYMGRDPDGRFDLEDSENPDYLDALEDLLQYRASEEKCQFTWHKLPRAWSV